MNQLDEISKAITFQTNLILIELCLTIIFDYLKSIEDYENCGGCIP